MDNTDLDALAVELLRAQKLLRDARYNVEIIEHELLKHLAENNITEVRTEHYVLSEKAPPETYEWNAPALFALLEQLSSVTENVMTLDEVRDMAQEVTTARVKTIQLLKMAKRRGFADRLALTYTKSPRGNKHINVEEAK